VEERKEGKLAGGPLGGLDAARLSMSAVSYGCLLKSGIPFLSGTQEVARFTIFRKRLESTYKYRFAKPPNGHKRLDTLAVGQHNKRPWRNTVPGRLLITPLSRRAASLQLSPRHTCISYHGNGLAIQEEQGQASPFLYHSQA
jgi:hypothetical protein